MYRTLQVRSLLVGVGPMIMQSELQTCYAGHPLTLPSPLRKESWNSLSKVRVVRYSLFQCT